VSNPKSDSSADGAMGMGAKLAAAKRLQFGLVIVAVFALSLVLNAATPLIADDYTFRLHLPHSVPSPVAR